MQCQQARQLFDTYLDGELSPSLATELGAHRLKCPDCRQALALMEVSGHILRSDPDPVVASDDFTDRLLACVEPVPQWRRRALKVVYYGAPLAAAAVIALAFVGVFDGKRPSHVAGVQHVLTAPVETVATPRKDDAPAGPAQQDPAEAALNQFVEETSQRIQNQGDSMQRVLDLTVLQMIDILEEAKERSQREGTAPPVLDATKQVEDLETEESDSPVAGEEEIQGAEADEPIEDSSDEAPDDQEESDTP